MDYYNKAKTSRWNIKLFKTTTFTVFTITRILHWWNIHPNWNEIKIICIDFKMSKAFAT